MTEVKQQSRDEVRELGWVGAFSHPRSNGGLHGGERSECFPLFRTLRLGDGERSFFSALPLAFAPAPADAAAAAAAGLARLRASLMPDNVSQRLVNPGP